MPTLDWLRAEFHYGYDSGDVLSWIPGRRRWGEERKCGGSYRRVFTRVVRPRLFADSKVLELGPGRGSWSRAILRHIPNGELHTVDFQDVSPWLHPDLSAGRLVCHRVQDNTFAGLPDRYFDFFWSFGVLCHNEIESIGDILRSARAKMKTGGIAAHQYGDWSKLDHFGWERGGVPTEFRNKPDREIWWPRNDQATMCRIAGEAGWEVLQGDVGLLGRDPIIVLRNP
ncbi:conserved protein of unknown function [Nitrospira japonica]|uniref:Methyltransferase domain-containing protein n=1 Tax=Nitrospira japonica TaxID=1325564 RepID=A0A1W1I084_9BACT|nr:class I SAM-dependent methyltransferase [Nitrospira japonica]SLM46410.1 conserved protein of unknown function [Nitrospira japonica]